MHRRVIAVLAAFALAAIGIGVTATDANALAKIKCKQTTGTANVDPIVRHNEEPSMMQHLHQFFGNNSWLSLANPNTANLGDLKGQGTNCADTGDTAGYWVPAVVDTRTGKTLAPQAFTAYYRTFDGKSHGPASSAELFPPDTRLVAPQTSVSPGAHGWSCGQFSGTGSTATIPDCSNLSQKAGYVLTAHINFPSCWDGVKPTHSASDTGDTRDNAHYAYPVKSGKNWVCPSAFPRKMLQLRETIQFPNPDKVPVQYLAVTSDAMANTTNGASMHADFWQAWEDDAFLTMQQTCIVGTAKSSLCG